MIFVVFALYLQIYLGVLCNTALSVKDFLASALAQFLKARIISARVVIKLYGATLT